MSSKLTPVFKICELSQKEEDMVCVDPDCTSQNIATCYKCSIKNHKQHELVDITQLLDEISQKISGLDNNYQNQNLNNDVDLVENLIKQAQIIFNNIMFGFEQSLQAMKQALASNQAGLTEINMIKNIQQNLSSYDVLNNLKGDFAYLNQLNKHTTEEMSKFVVQSKKCFTSNMKTEIEDLITQLNAFQQQQEDQKLDVANKQAIKQPKILDGVDYFDAKKFAFTSEKDKKGIIYWIGTNCGKNREFKNPLDSKKINIISQQGYYNIKGQATDGRHDLRDIVDDENSIEQQLSCCSSYGSNNNFIIDLVSYMVRIDTIVLGNTYMFDTGTYLSDNMIIKGSNDEKQWNDIPVQLLSSKNPYKVFKVKERSKEFYQFIKIQESNQSYQILLSKIEFYGDIIPAKRRANAAVNVN